MPKKKTQKTAEQRGAPRAEMYGDMILHDPSVPSAPLAEGVIVNMSASGVSIFLHQPLKEGARLSLRIKGIWKEYKPVTAKWCRQVEDGVYQVGLSIP